MKKRHEKPPSSGAPPRPVEQSSTGTPQCTGGLSAGDVEKLVDEIEKRQAELAHMSRLSLLGEMASGLAHELNQPLTAIILHLRASARRVRSGSLDVNELLEDMEHTCLEAERAGRIIHFLRDFTRKGEPKTSATDINKTVRQAVGFADGEVRQKEIAVRFELADRLPPVWADRIQIEQVILNLVRNAIEAMDDTNVSERELSIRTATAVGDQVEVSIRDTGKGLPAGTPEQVFDTFFTTKAEGLGMGLSISRSIIEAHGGRLWATPNRERGVTFRFTLRTVEGGTCDAI